MVRTKSHWPNISVDCRGTSSPNQTSASRLASSSSPPNSPDLHNSKRLFAAAPQLQPTPGTSYGSASYATRRYRCDVVRLLFECVFVDNQTESMCVDRRAQPRGNEPNFYWRYTCRMGRGRQKAVFKYRIVMRCCEQGAYSVTRVLRGLHSAKW